MNHQDYMRQALSLARKGMEKGDGGPFGALVVHQGTIIGEAWNQVIADNDPTAHAEVVAIRRAAARIGHFHLGGSLLYTSCEPCPMCLGAAYWAHIDRIYFAARGEDAARIGFADDFILSQLRLDPLQRSLPAENLLHDEGQALFEQFTRLAQRAEY